MVLPVAAKDTDIACSGITGHMEQLGHVGQLGHAGHRGFPEIRLSSVWNVLSPEEAVCAKLILLRRFDNEF